MTLFKRRKDKNLRKITHHSNVIQYDDMGYPLRLVIVNNKEHVWLDTINQAGDVELKWKEAKGNE